VGALLRQNATASILVGIAVLALLLAGGYVAWLKFGRRRFRHISDGAQKGAASRHRSRVRNFGFRRRSAHGSDGSGGEGGAVHSFGSISESTAADAAQPPIAAAARPSTASGTRPLTPTRPPMPPPQLPLPAPAGWSFSLRRAPAPPREADRRGSASPRWGLDSAAWPHNPLYWLAARSGSAGDERSVAEPSPRSGAAKAPSFSFLSPPRPRGASVEELAGADAALFAEPGGPRPSGGAQASPGEPHPLPQAYPPGWWASDGGGVELRFGGRPSDGAAAAAAAEEAQLTPRTRLTRKQELYAYCNYGLAPADK
jgi:hypothetical protein